MKQHCKSKDAYGHCKVDASQNSPSPVLLTIADYFGTLAAARHLGSLGIPVAMANDTSFAPAMWSNHVSRREKAPAITDTEAYTNWLVEFGSRNPGHVLYPTSDETAWIIALHQERLKPYYQMYSPPFDTICRILNKQKLYEACSEVGLATPATYFPQSLANVEQLSGKLEYPVIIKPKTQAFLNTHVKGRLVSGEDELLGGYNSFMEVNTYPLEMKDRDPSIAWPMVQSYHPHERRGIYSISGFVNATGSCVAVRACRKILQQPRRIGIGLCFEEASVDPALCDQVLSLCKRLNYYGVFEVEFILSGTDDSYMLIDFNPRYYNQMRFDIDRGMPLPEIAYYAATRDEVRLARAIGECNKNEKGSRVYCFKQMFWLLLRAQRLSGSMGAADWREWRRWYHEHRHTMTDPMTDRADYGPNAINLLLELRKGLQHPRGFVNGILFK